jgi:multicomponent K+:H+ antiporter subunit G
VRALLVSALLVVGAAFALVGSVGLARLPDFYARLHGPTKATTLGVGAMLAASAVWFSGRGAGVSLHELLVAGFLFLTAPASAHLMAKAARHLGAEDRSRPAEGWAPDYDARRGAGPGPPPPER